MFRFADPNFLYLLILLPFLVALYLYSNYHRRQNIRKYGDPALLKGLMPTISKYRPDIKFWLIFAALTLVILMLARPQFGSKMETVKRSGVEAVIALDISNSMLAEDVTPSRLDKSKKLISRLVDTFNNDKVGLIVFAGDAFTQLPITSDYVSAKMFLETINPSLITTQGTDIGAAIRLNIMGINYRIPDLEGFNAVNAFIGEGTINVTCLDPTAEIHYTTDGSTPTLQSPVYEGPIKVTETTDFTFCTFRPNGKKGDIAKTRFIKSEYTPSVTAAPSNPGLKATWYEFKGNKCSEIEKAPINGTYPVEDVMIPKKVKGNIGLIIKGYFNAPQDDIYTFALLSDDGSTLTIDSEQIVDNDGPHGPKEIVGQKALAKGYHPMELRYFDQNGGQLKLKVTGSDGKEIPFTHLYAH